MKLKIQFIEQYAIIYAAKERERENTHVQVKSKGCPKLVMPTPRGRSGGAKTRSGKRTSHEYTLYTVLQFKIILPSKRIVYLKKHKVHADLLSFPTNTSGTFHFSMNTLGIYQFSPIKLQQWITRDLKLSVGRHMWP